MTQPRILLATLALNEAEWLPYLWEQHKNWPGLVSWVFVEAADIAYAQANPDMVSDKYLSVDGTTEFLNGLLKQDDRVTYLPFGLVQHHSDRAQGKVKARDGYLRVAELVKPDWIVTLDADEFYPYASQHTITEHLARLTRENYTGACLKIREMWRAPSISFESLFKREVVGGLWRMHHCHLWRWFPRMRHSKSHNWPELDNGTLLNYALDRWDLRADCPQWLHLGWASNVRNRLAKTRYYRQRGEGMGDGRRKWMMCREAWESWRPGNLLPYGARVVPYDGPIPEAFQQVKAT